MNVKSQIIFLNYGIIGLCSTSAPSHSLPHKWWSAIYKLNYYQATTEECVGLYYENLIVVKKESGTMQSL